MKKRILYPSIHCTLSKAIFDKLYTIYGKYFKKLYLYEKHELGETCCRAKSLPNMISKIRCRVTMATESSPKSMHKID